MNQSTFSLEAQFLYAETLVMQVLAFKGLVHWATCNLHSNDLRDLYG